MNWPSYLIQANIYLVLFYAFYVLVLQNETFFKWNRTYLVSSAALSFLIPLIQSEWVKSLFVTEHIQEVSQAIIIQPVALNEIQIAADSGRSLTIAEWVGIIYLAGAIIFFLKFLWELSRVSRSFKDGVKAQSFFFSIKVSEELPERESILKHEKVHARQLHSADVIFFEIIGIINWFNPVVYACKKSIKYIHEFIADEAAAEENGKSEYALLLVSNAFGIQKEQLTNNFYNQSLLKKRIMMLHKMKSRKAALLKYGLSAPLFAAMVVFSSAAVEKTNVEAIKSINITEPAEAIETIVRSFERTVPGPGQTRKIEGVKTVSENSSLAVEENNTNPAVTAGRIDTGVYNQAGVEVKPEYPGGMNKFIQWVGANYRFPREAKDANVRGRMIVQFVIEKDGSVTDIKIPRDLGYGTGEVAKELLAKSIKWKPGIKNGKPVRVQYTLPIMLQTTGSEKVILDSVRIWATKPTTGKPLIIIDGKRLEKEVPSSFNFGSATEAEYAELLGIKASDIRGISIIKNEDGSAYTTLSITTTEGKNEREVALEKREVALRKSNLSKISSLQIDGSRSGEKPLYIFDGKEITPEEFKKILPASIEAITVRKDKEQTLIYGEKGKNGVIIITSKK